MKTTVVWLIFGLLVITNIVLGLLLMTGEGSEATAQENTTEVAGESTDASQSSVEAGSAPQKPGEYSAKASKFTLALPEEYRIIVRHDGGEDSYRSTQLTIGRTTGSSGPVESAADDYVKIEAYPSDVNGTRDQFVTADTALQGNSADEAAKKIDGTDARQFTLEGVGKTVKYYFERDGMTYFIEAYDVSSGDTQLMLDDAIRGFRFN